MMNKIIFNLSLSFILLSPMVLAGGNKSISILDTQKQCIDLRPDVIQPVNPRAIAQRITPRDWSIAIATSYPQYGTDEKNDLIYLVQKILPDFLSFADTFNNLSLDIQNKRNIMLTKVLYPGVRRQEARLLARFLENRLFMQRVLTTVSITVDRTMQMFQQQTEQQ